jgi:hypothetical protein
MGRMGCPESVQRPSRQGGGAAVAIRAPSRRRSVCLSVSVSLASKAALSAFVKSFGRRSVMSFRERCGSLAGVRKSPKNEPAVSRGELWGFVVLGEAVVAEIERAAGDGAQLWADYYAE